MEPRKTTSMVEFASRATGRGLVEINHLREFLVYTKHLNYTAAAKELFISQPTLMQHINSLSDEVGAPLVSQEGKPHLTMAGELLFSYAQSLCAEYEDMLEAIRLSIEKGRSTLRILDERTSFPLAESVARAQMGAPGEPPLNVALVPADQFHNRSIFDVLDEGLLDIGFTYQSNSTENWYDGDEFSAYEFLPVAVMQLRLYVAANSPLASRDSVTLEDVRTLRIARNDDRLYETTYQAIDAYFEKMGIPLNIVSATTGGQFYLPQTSPRFGALISEIGCESLLISGITDGAALAFSEEAPSCLVLAVWRKDNDNPALPEFITNWKRALD